MIRLNIRLHTRLALRVAHTKPQRINLLLSHQDTAQPALVPAVPDNIWLALHRLVSSVGIRSISVLTWPFTALVASDVRNGIGHAKRREMSHSSTRTPAISINLPTRTSETLQTGVRRVDLSPLQYAIRRLYLKEPVGPFSSCAEEASGLFSSPVAYSSVHPQCITP